MPEFNTIIFLLFSLASLIQLGFWLGIFSRLAFYRVRKVNESENQQPISVIICARNEAENLRKNLPHFLNQSYRSFEIVVVNDNSTDKTESVLLDFKRKYPNLRHICLRNSTPPGKKVALSFGINAAEHNVLLLSDADCRPATKEWLKIMQASIDEQAEIGLGFSPYEFDNSFLNTFIRFETAYTATQYFSFTLIGMPYMGVGRNLIYKKDLYNRTGGFNGHLDIASGDDDLFINEAARYDNTRIVLNPEAFVYSKPKISWRGYYRQKTRHLTTGRHYKPAHVFMLGMLSASHFGHYLGLMILLIGGNYLTECLIIYLVRIGVVSSLYWCIYKKLDETNLFKLTPLLDALYIFYYFTFIPSLLTGKREKWN